jgi:hypothetical protein
MRTESEFPSYNQFYERLVNSKSKLLGDADSRYHGIINDLYEAWEDFETLGPLFNKIILNSLTDEEIRKIFLEFEARIWHLRDHLKMIHTAIEHEYDANA